MRRTTSASSSRTAPAAASTSTLRPWRFVSFELSGFFTRQSGAITANGSTLVAAGRLDAIPVVLEVKVHPFGDGTFDLYLGGGGTYVWFQNLSDTGLDAAGIGVVNVKNKAGFAASAGLRLAFSPHAAFLVDAKVPRGQARIPGRVRSRRRTSGGTRSSCRPGSGSVSRGAAAVRLPDRDSVA